jgi:hypothetical protein
MILTQHRFEKYPKEVVMTFMQRAAIICCSIFLPAVCAAAAGAPHRVGGIVLGAEIDAFQKHIVPGSTLPVRYLESLKEAEVRQTPGFKTGLVYYGTCVTPSRIVRIEFKYEDPSKSFYEELLKRFKQRHGEPAEWRGDPFHIVVGWKWKFVDRKGNDISLILKHNKRDEEKKEGNYVKMTMWNLMRLENECYQGKLQEDTGSADTGPEAGPIDWDLLVPR